MKHNLKNRPDRALIQPDIHNWKKWFEGFEAELREELKKLQESGASDMLAENIYEEILGE